MIQPNPNLAPYQAQAANAFNQVAGVIILFVILFMINKTRLGRTLLYYSLVLTIILILVTQSGFIVRSLQSVATSKQLPTVLIP